MCVHCVIEMKGKILSFSCPIFEGFWSRFVGKEFLDEGDIVKMLKGDYEWSQLAKYVTCGIEFRKDLYFYDGLICM